MWIANVHREGVSEGGRERGEGGGMKDTKPTKSTIKA